MEKVQEMENGRNEEVSNGKDVEDVAAVDADLISVSGKNKEGSSKGKHRTKHKCPYSSCSVNIVHLPRHMRHIHKWDEKDSIGVLGYVQEVWDTFVGALEKGKCYRERNEINKRNDSSTNEYDVNKATQRRCHQEARGQKKNDH
ncbi:Hypothetical predicted protein [Paramuricea clavata]|uniref:Uncharacterized protein n=1 Tax=Paramuricea clavata TaxID=317549 RepID=A0A7D9HQM9_PARCT|nr:Hypothetical predicted protein [Paramuricea clavata]